MMASLNVSTVSATKDEDPIPKHGSRSLPIPVSAQEHDAQTNVIFPVPLHTETGNS